MSPEAQRIAIAEACGWHSFRDIGGDSETKLWGHPSHLKRTSLPTELVPDYLTDLNAMHEAVKSLPNEMQWAWFAALAVIVPAKGPAALGNAEQWAKSFLRTLGKWDDSK